MSKQTRVLPLFMLPLICLTLTGCPSGSYNPPDDRPRAGRDPYDDIRTPAELDGWTFLGRREVDFGGDHDTIVVGGSHGKFKAVKFAVERGDIELYDLVIQVGKDFIRPAVRERFHAGTASRAIDLPGDKRTIGRVDFSYRSTDRRDGRAIVSLYAK